MSDYDKPATVDMNVEKNLGPLAALAGTWEGKGGIDVAPSPKGPVETKYRERRTLVPFGPVINGKQVLYGLRYASLMWPEGAADPYHEETGYWLWDAAAQQIYCCFVVPRGVVVNCGGAVAANAKSFALSAELGSKTYGILSTPFLDAAYQTVRYDFAVEVHSDGSFTYTQDTHIKMQNRAEVFHHTDRNTMRKVS